MSWLPLAVGPFVIALLLGAFTQIRISRLLLPPLALALVYWVGVGGSAQTGEFDRAALLLITGVIGALFVLIWFACVVVGRWLRVVARSFESNP